MYSGHKIMSFNFCWKYPSRDTQQRPCSCSCMLWLLLSGTKAGTQTAREVLLFEKLKYFEIQPQMLAETPPFPLKVENDRFSKLGYEPNLPWGPVLSGEH